MNYNEKYPRRSRYLSGSDLGGEVVVAVIEKVEMEQMRHPRDPKRTVERPVMFFKGHGKGLILTQDADDSDDEQEQTPACRQLIAIYGPHDDQWPGKTVELFP